jgi:hypothetical protein
VEFRSRPLLYAMWILAIQQLKCQAVIVGYSRRGLFCPFSYFSTGMIFVKRFAGSKPGFTHVYRLSQGA